MSVVFPHPDGPMIAVNLFVGIVTQIPFNASVPSAKRFVTLSKRIKKSAPLTYPSLFPISGKHGLFRTRQLNILTPDCCHQPISPKIRPISNQSASSEGLCEGL